MPKTFKIITILFMFVSMPYCAYAQFIDMSLGIRGGLSLASYSRDVDFGSTLLDESLSSNNIERVTGGVVFSGKLSPIIGFNVEGMFVNKGGSVDASTFSSANLTPVNRNYRSDLNYLQFSLIPKIVLDQTPVFGFFGDIGVYTAFLTSAKEEVRESTFQQERLLGRDISGSISGTDFGMIFMGGVNLSSISLEARYSLGFTNIVKDPSISSHVKAKNNVISFLIGYNFALL